MEFINVLLYIVLTITFTSSAPIRYNMMDYHISKIANNFKYNDEIFNKHQGMVI